MRRLLWLTAVALLHLPIASGQVSESQKRHEQAGIAKLARITRVDHSTIFFYGLTDAGYIRDGAVHSVILEHGTRRSDFNYCMGQAVSGDGSQIAYAAAADGPTGCRIMIRDLRADTERVLTVTEETVGDVSWLPRDTEIAYHHGSVHFAVSVANGTKRPLPPLPSASSLAKRVSEDADCAAISPSGTHIAYVAHGTLWISDVDGSNRYAVTSVPHLLFLPFNKGTPWNQIVWSPAEDRLWFDTVVDEGGNTNLYLVDIRSGEKRRILKHTFITVAAWR